MTVQLYLGDCIQFMRTLSDGGIDLSIFSPPYNCRKAYGTFVDEMPWSDYYDWIKQVLEEVYRVTVLGGVVAVNVPGVVRWQAQHKYSNTWQGFDPEYKTHRDGKKVVGKGRIEPLGFRLFEIMQALDPHMREPIMWVKGSEGNAISSDYRMGCDSDPYMRPAHEWILLGSKGRWFHRGGAGRRGRDAVPFIDYTKDVWFMTPDRSNHHPAPFPIELPLRLIRLFVHAKDAVVFDPFAGKGTTALACLEAGVNFVGCEIDPIFHAYAERSIREAQMQLAPPEF